MATGDRIKESGNQGIRDSETQRLWDYETLGL